MEQNREIVLRVAVFVEVKRGISVSVFGFWYLPLVRRQIVPLTVSSCSRLCTCVQGTLCLLEKNNLTMMRMLLLIFGFLRPSHRLYMAPLWATCRRGP